MAAGIPRSLLDWGGLIASPPMAMGIEFEVSRISPVLYWKEYASPMAADSAMLPRPLHQSITDNGPSMFLYFLHMQSWLLSLICRFLLSLPRETTYKKFSKVELQVCNHNRNKAMEQECAAELCIFCLIELFPSRKSLMFGGRKKISSKWFSHMMYFSGPHASFPGIVGAVASGSLRHCSKRICVPHEP